MGYDILCSAKRRRSILVRPAGSEEGPKNPFKGIAVKPLVPASYAQFGVGAEWKVRICALAEVGRSPMACGSRPCLCGDLTLCIGVLPCGIFDLCTNQGGTCIAVLPGLRAVNAVCRVACLAWKDANRSASPALLPGQGERGQLLETLSAKEARKR